MSLVNSYRETQTPYIPDECYHESLGGLVSEGMQDHQPRLEA